MNAPLQLVLTVAWLVSLSINCSGQIPSDTNKLTEISVEQAGDLAAKSTNGIVSLNGLKTLSSEVAAALAKSSVPIYLDGLATLSPEVATELARYQGSGISLSGINTLNPEAAQILANQDRLFLPTKVLLPSKETALPITFSRAWDKKAIVRRESDSATVKLGNGPQLFFRDATSKEFVTPGPKLPAGSDAYKPGLSAKCWSFSPDGKLVAIGSEYRRGRGSDPDDPVCIGNIRVWEVATGKLVSHRGGRELGAIKKCAFSEDGKTIYFDADRYVDSR